jgi:hypothetical protein
MFNKGSLLYSHCGCFSSGYSNIIILFIEYNGRTQCVVAKAWGYASTVTRPHYTSSILPLFDCFLLLLLMLWCDPKPKRQQSC